MNLLVRPSVFSRISSSFAVNSFTRITLHKGYVELPSKFTFTSTTRKYSSSTEKNKAGNDELDLIYTGKFSKRVIRVKLFSLMTSAMGLYAQPVLFQKGLEISNGYALGVAMGGVAAIFTFVTPVLLHLITKKYVLEVKHNPRTDEYIATTATVFLTRRNTKFKVEEIHIPDFDGMFTAFEVGPKRVPLFVDPTGFTDTHHYARFMGYDKPVEVKFEQDIEKLQVKNDSNGKAK